MVIHNCDFSLILALLGPCRSRLFQVPNLMQKSSCMFWLICIRIDSWKGRRFVTGLTISEVHSWTSDFCISLFQYFLIQSNDIKVKERWSPKRGCIVFPPHLFIWAEANKILRSNPTVLQQRRDDGKKWGGKLVLNLHWTSKSEQVTVFESRIYVCRDFIKKFTFFHITTVFSCRQTSFCPKDETAIDTV